MTRTRGAYLKWGLGLGAVLLAGLALVLFAPARLGGYELGRTDLLAQDEATAQGEGSTEETTAADPLVGEEPRSCGSEDDELVYLANADATLAVAADREGRFAFYGLPDPSGKPTTDSYDLLRGCNGENFSPLNSASLRVADPDAMTSYYGGSYAEGEGEVLVANGEDAIVEETRLENGALVTAYRFGGGITLTQTLKLARTDGSDAANALQIAYRLENASPEARKVGLRSLLVPTAAAGRLPHFYATALEGRAPAGGGGPEVEKERVLFAVTRQVGPVYAPREGAASDAGGVWRPDQGARTPDRVTFAEPRQFERWRFVYDIRPDWPLGDEPALAAYWLDEDLPAGSSRSFAHSYAAEPQGGS